ncbi:hypothetical protein NR798_18175 [Archangium gephyra]|uniref:hypothetical protein n=1 Tax=Archangium gephyra TaxID=48 RepID=UPI0035D4433D
MSGRFEARGDVGIIWIDNPPVNAISQAVRVALLDGLKQAEADTAIKVELKAGAVARWWTPSPLLERLVAEGKGFAQAV